MIIILLALIGFVLLIIGRLPVSFRRTVKGLRARFVGIVLILPVLIVFLLAFATAFMSGFTRQELDPQGFNAFIGGIQLPLTLIGLLLTFVITYWPQGRKATGKTDDDLAALYPGQSGESLTPGQAAFQLGLSDSKLQQLINDGSLTLIETHGNTFIDKASFDSFMLCQKGAQAAKNGQLESALIDFDEAVKLNPRSVRARFLRGKAYLGLGYYAEAYIDLQFVSNSGQNYPQIDELLARTKQALRSGGSTTKFAVKRNRSQFVNDLTGGPIYLAAMLIVAALAILFAANPFILLNQRDCQLDAKCFAPYLAGTVQARDATGAVLLVSDTAQVAQVNTGIANHMTVAAPTTHFEQTQYPILMATSTALRVNMTQASIQITNAVGTGVPIPEKLLIDTKSSSYLTNLNDGQVEQVDPSSPTPTGPPPHAKYVYASDGQGVYFYNGYNATQVLGFGHYGEAAMSPDATSFVVVNFGTKFLDLVSTHNIPTTPSFEHLVAIAPSQTISTLRWSADGNTLTYCLSNDPKSGIYQINFNTGKVQPLVLTRLVCPVIWSPDGQRIAFRLSTYPGNEFYYDHTYWQVLTMNGDGTDRRVVFWDFDDSLTGPSEPVWSLDSKYLAFIVGGQKQDVFVVDVAGTNLRNVAWHKDTSPTQNQLFAEDVSWEP